MPENTPNLDLYLKNPLTDGADTFNIETMINENFRKIDENTARVGVDGKLDPAQRAEAPVTEAIGDLDNYKTTGKFISAAGVANNPNALNSYYVEVMANGALVLQIAYGRVNPNLMFMRRFNGTWGPWDNYSKGVSNGIALQDDLTTHTADGAAHGIGDKSTLLTTSKSTIVSAVNELFTNANNLKSDWAGVVGSPLLSSDTSAQLKSKTQTLKNELATNLSAKGQSSVGTETLDALVDKVALVNTGKPIKTGSASSNSTSGMTVTGLGFKPKIIIWWNSVSYVGGFYNGYDPFANYLRNFDTLYGGTATLQAKNTATITTDGFTVHTGATLTMNWLAIGE